MYYNNCKESYIFLQFILNNTYREIYENNNITMLYLNNKPNLPNLVTIIVIIFSLTDFCYLLKHYYFL